MNANLFEVKSREFLSSFENHCLPYCKYEPKGITNIEGFYWWASVGMFKPDFILESGVSKGRSTQILGLAQKYFNIPNHFAFEKSTEHEKYVRSKLKGLNTVYTIGNSDEAFEKILSTNPESKIMAVVDGPKSGEPFSRVINASLSFKNLCCILVHDCSKKSRIPESLNKLFKEFNPSNLIITYTDVKINNGLQYLNDNIKDDLYKIFKEMNKEEKLEDMQCVGVIYNPGMIL